MIQFSPYSATENGGGPVVIWSQHGAPLTGGVTGWTSAHLHDWIHVSSMAAGRGLPLLVPKDAQYAAFENIYRFDYPKPFKAHLWRQIRTVW